VYIYLVVPPVLRDEHCVVSLIWLKSELFKRLESLALELFHLAGEYHLSWGSGIDTARLDRHERVSVVFEEVLRVERDDTGLVGLRDVGEDHVYEGEEHAVFVGVTGVFDDGDNVCSFFCHVDQVTAGSVGELDGVHDTLWADYISDMADTSSARRAEVKNLLSRGNENIIETTENTSSQLASERIPNAVLGFGRSGRRIGGGALDGYPFFAVDALAGHEVLGDEEVLFAFGDEDTGVTMGFEDDVCTTSGAASASAAPTSCTATSRRTTAASPSSSSTRSTSPSSCSTPSSASSSKSTTSTSVTAASSTSTTTPSTKSTTAA